MEWVINAEPRSLYRWDSDSLPILQEAGWAPWQARKGAKKFGSHRVLTPNHLSRDDSLYRLSYPGRL